MRIYLNNLSSDDISKIQFDTMVFIALPLLLYMNNKYEDYMDKVWLLIQICSKEIQRNKQILEAICADDRDAILKKIKI